MDIAGRTGYRRMAALGSSFAAGPGIAPVADRAAGRSLRNYPRLVAAALGAELTDATVSGATTATILDTAQRARGRRFPPQIEAIVPGTDLVTITAGGNDLGYIGGMTGAALLARLRRTALSRPLARRLRERHPLRPPTPEALAAAATGLQRIVEEARRRAPGARIVLVDYLPVLGDDSSGPASPVSPTESAHFLEVAGALSIAFREAREATGCDLVPASAYEPRHGLGSAEPWVLGLQRGRGRGAPMHPSAAGMRGVADAVLRHLGRSAADRPGP